MCSHPILYPSPIQTFSSLVQDFLYFLILIDLRNYQDLMLE